MAEQRKRLYRSRTNRMIAGVLGGLAEYMGLPPLAVRAAYVVLALVTGVVPSIVVYVVMALVVRQATETV